MPIEFTMPKLGHLMKEGTIISWKKREGDRIEKGEILLEIETEKAAIEMESDMSGILLKIIVREGKTVEVGTPLAVVGEEAEL